LGGGASCKGEREAERERYRGGADALSQPTDEEKKLHPAARGSKDGKRGTATGMKEKQPSS